MKSEGETKIWLDKEPNDIVGWLLTNDGLQWKVQRVTRIDDEDRMSGTINYCSSLEYAIKMYVKMRTKDLGADTLDELGKKLDELNEHVADIKKRIGVSKEGKL